MKWGQIMAGLAGAGMIIGGVWTVDARFYQRTEAAEKHKELEGFTIEVAGRLDRKISQDDYRAARSVRWDILGKYGKQQCITVPNSRDRKDCLEAEADMEDLKRKKKRK